MAKAKTPAVEDKQAEIARLRAEREAIAKRIHKDQARKSELSARIRELEGPLPDRSNRKATGFSLKPSKG